MDTVWVIFVRLVSVWYISYVSLQSFMSSELSVKELSFISYLLFSHNSCDHLASAPLPPIYNPIILPPLSSLCISSSSLKCRLAEMQTIVVLGERLGALGAFDRLN